MNQDSNIYIESASSRVALYEDQTLCTQLLKTITVATPLQILPSKIPGAGVGLFITKNIEDGEEIFRSEPLVNCVMNGMQSLVCDYCYCSREGVIHPSGRFRTTEDTMPDMKACGGCKFCYYCSKACQKKAWKRYHKYECVMFSEAPNMHPRTRALYRLLNMNKNELLSNELWVALNGLQPHVKEHLSTANAELVIGASQFARARTDTDLSISEVLSLYCTLLTNSLCIFPAEGKTIGTSLDIVASLMNHSCDPNAFVFFEGSSLRVRSIRKLLSGDEITQSYTDVDMDALIRQQVLKSDFFFACHCNRCEKQIRTHEERFPGKIDQLERSQQQLIQLINEAVCLTDVNKIEADVRNIATQVFPDGNWPDDLEPLPSLRIRLAGILKAQGRLIDALKQGIRGCMLSERRIGGTWVRNLFDLLQIIARVVSLPKQTTSIPDPDFPNQDQMWHILHGYLHELVLGATKTFGSGTGYTKAIKGWYSDCLRSDNAPEPGTKAFAKRFKKAQSKLLLWAGVDENRAIVLT
ncbi:SET domain-containing protein [Melanomma pulvis-pyrius CBS 109.77]|uniref:SET domain-containing protein n=1 Tax=Melanomma pulvis-pyrius CBS 109.77 TaxID=1314802 RepID=A0A6A6XTC8_9PLEO|nr:SET domain-containing protein [Melanomma pulvis-pyrius CBS 109.77]